MERAVGAIITTENESSIVTLSHLGTETGHVAPFGKCTRFLSGFR